MDGDTIGFRNDNGETYSDAMKEYPLDGKNYALSLLGGATAPSGVIIDIKNNKYASIANATTELNWQDFNPPGKTDIIKSIMYEPPYW